jgi:hypothetical protein
MNIGEIEAGEGLNAWEVGGGYLSWWIRPCLVQRPAFRSRTCPTNASRKISIRIVD